MVGYRILKFRLRSWSSCYMFLVAKICCIVLDGVNLLHLTKCPSSSLFLGVSCIDNLELEMRLSLPIGTSSSTAPFVTVPPLPQERRFGGFLVNGRRGRGNVGPLVMGNLKRISSSLAVMSTSTDTSKVAGVPIMVNGCSGKMGQAVIRAADSAGLNVLPVSFGSPDESGTVVEVCEKKIQVYGQSEREDVLASLYEQNPNLIVVDYTVPSAVNDNADLYCKVGVPFVMGTTGGDRDLLLKTVEKSKVYAVISPQMGKQVVGFLAAMEIMAEQFPGAFSGYSLQVMESHQASKLDTSGTAKAVISCFQKLGVSYDMSEIRMIRDPKRQLEMVGVPQEYLSGHAFHMYHLMSPDESVSFEFQHNVCGRSIYAEGTVDSVLFLAKKVGEKADKRIYNMIDVLREGNMR